jgi:S1-C subfamily serine protease
MRDTFAEIFYFVTFLFLISIICFADNNKMTTSKENYILQTSIGSYTNLKNNKDSQIFIDSVLKLDYIDEMDSVSSATGFSVIYKGDDDISYILTNEHFCEKNISGDKGTFYYELPNVEISTTSRIFVDSLKVVASKKAQDLCLLSMNGYIKPVKLAPDGYEISRMEPIIIVGSPHEQFPVVRETFITNTVSIKEVFSWMSLNAPALFISDIVLPGESGSPIYNKKGDVIGIVDATMSNGSIVFGGVGISYVDIKSFLKETRL